MGLVSRYAKHLLAALAALWIGCTKLERGPVGHAEDASPTPEPTRIEGRVLLPEGEGPRGVEVQAHANGTVLWARLDADGRFTISPQTWPVHVSVVAASTEVAGLDVAQAGEVELDARASLRAHRVRLVPAKAEAEGGVRVGVWTGEVPRGPKGSLPSLGSAQFPDRRLPSESEWLLPLEASVTFLVERPADHARGREWKSGAQQLFGPYEVTALPEALVID